MTGVSLWSTRHKNAGLVDVIWGYGFGLLALIYALSGNGTWPHQVLIAGMVGLASVRLGSHLLRRFLHEQPIEDARYHTLRKTWDEEHPPKTVDWLFIGIFFGQGLLIWILSHGFWWICENPSPGLHPVEYAGLALWLLAMAGETMADEQLHRFKQQNPGKICDVGLWRYSRHPNYFFQWLLWVSYTLVAIAMHHGIWYLAAPVLMYLFLNYGTGVAMTEAQSLKRRGAPYRRYQEKTSAFFLWFPKRDGL